MQSRVFPPLVEVFLILEQPRQRLSHWAAALAPLDGAPAPPIATVTAYYDPTCDQALLGMRYDQLALGPERLAYVVEVALRAEIGMIQPSELSDGERDRILGERLARCALSVTDQRTIVNALSELVRRVREQKLGCPIGDEPAPVPKPPPADPIPMLAAARRRRTTQSPRLNVPAKSTRDELSRLRRGHLASPARSPLAKSTRELAREIRVETAKLRAERRLGTDADAGAPASRDSRTLITDPPAPPTPLAPIGRTRPRPAEARPAGRPPPIPTTVPRKLSPALEARRLSTPPQVRPVPRPEPPTRPLPPPPPQQPPAQAEPEPPALDARPSRITARMTSPHVLPRPPSPQVLEPEEPHVHRAATVEMPSHGPELDEPHRHRAATVQMDPLQTQRLAAAAGPPEATPPRPAPRMTMDLPVAPNMIYARYLRGGRWVPVRIGALSLRGAALMGGALPRLHEGVDIALAFAEHRALVRGQVHKVSTEEEAAQTGAASFHIAFELDEPARRQLTALLIAARAAKVTIKPPPTRRNRRYPVEWPVCLGTMRGALRGEVLDISRGGMFVRPAGTLALDTQVTFSAMLDDDADPVSGRSRVVRYINEADARTCGLAQGYGLKIVQMASLERERWTSFVARIERRAEKRVLIGASAGRLLELQSSLAAVGYVATGAAEPDALAALAGHARAVDACLLDASWLPQRVSASWAEGLFPARRVPCVTLHGDVRRARAALDQALSIV